NAWIWIDGILGLIKTYLVNLWHDGHIMGFVSNNKIHQLLQEKQAGTFLLHFSESHKDGAITFSWVDYDPQMNPHVYTPEPYTKKELETTPLPHIIQHYHLESKWDYRVPLVNLYPDKPKDTVFGCNKSQGIIARILQAQTEENLLPQSQIYIHVFHRQDGKMRGSPHTP
uniref:SH2 domain-containing protein n=1 Tax=Amphilophus citrinellus TaxID=61819 RepID=A0A3Q0RDR1_AMPCI